MADSRLKNTFLGTLLGAALAFSASSDAAAQALTKINIGVGGYTFGFLPIMYADAAKLFQDEKIEVTLINTGGGSNTMAALLGGSTDLGGLVFSDLILAAAKGQKVLAFAPLLTQYASDAVVSKKAAEKAGIAAGMPLKERMQRLKGMTLAVSSRGSGIDKMWRYLIELGGLDPDRDVTLTVVKTDQMYPALRAGQIDGYNLTAPANNRAVEEGLAVWVARPSQGEVPGLENFLYTVLAAKPDYIAKNGEVIERIMRVLQKANTAIQEDPAGVAKALGQSYLKQTDAALLEATVKDQRPAFPVRMTLTKEAYDQNLKFMTRFGDQVQGVQYTDIVEPKFTAKQ